MNNKNSNNTILEIKNVTISFGGEAVIKDINISLAEGELVSLLGKSGSGKTTLFNIISGLVPINVIADNFLPISLSECPQW